ncbi:interleukin-18 receptor accessory protein isoform X3 [Meriones unguiculatus]|uniref:interleukin-18 receptor accessory protein isoform X3 n=1 Tax=Meriones unguiculatus TaxID=10047 RepID=UPI000B4F00F6|nr:interleukin-18 receptor accessory protein isoform X3 [Meriones unguiculatus]
MLCLGWVFLWFVAGEQTSGFNHSACATKNILWIYSLGSVKDLVLFCDLQELRKQDFSHVSQTSPTGGPAHTRCSGHENLAAVQWYKQPQHGGPLEEISRGSAHVQDKGVLQIVASRENSVSSYICRPRIRSPQDTACCIRTVLKVKPRRNESCGDKAQAEQILFLGSTGSIHCPSLSCQSDLQRPRMTWYQDGRLLRDYKENPIEMEAIYDFHEGLYVCDYAQSDNLSSWTVRAVVRVKAIEKDINLKPDILDPVTDTLEVELGKSLTLRCKVQFGFQKDLKPVIRWYAKESPREWELLESENKSTDSTAKSKVIEATTFLREVTWRDLRREFVCFAQNSIGNTTRSVQLRKKDGAVFVPLLLGTAVVLVGLLVAAALLYWYWIEVVLLCRTCRSKDGTPRVYADDIVSVIKRSRRGIFILSPSYVNGPCIFELQAAVSLALVDQTLKLILIKFSSFQEPDSLPELVKKALRVLPTVTWKGVKSAHASSRFWMQVCYHMPVKNSSGFVFNRL